MKRFSVLVWAGLVSACAASSVVGCGDDDSVAPADPPSDPGDSGSDSSRAFPGRDAAGSDAPVDTKDTGAADSASDASSDASTDAETTDADADAGVDASKPDAGNDAGTDAGTDSGTDAGKDAGPAPACGATIKGTVTSVFPAGASVTGASIVYQPCNANGNVAANGSYSLSAATNVDGHLVASGAGFRKTLSADIFRNVFGGDPSIPIQLVGTGMSPFDSGKAHILIAINAVKNGCMKGGSTFRVSGHAEAIVQYVNAAGTDIGATTGTDGLIWVSNLNPGTAQIELQSTPVSGCFIDVGFGTGNLVLEANAVTVYNIDLRK